MIEDVATVKCPKCKQLVRVLRSYATGIEGIKKIAVRHIDHILVIGFDKYGVARNVYVYDLRENFEAGSPIANCPRCNKEISVSSSEHIDKFAVDHGDHVVVIFKVGKKFEITVIDKIEPFRGPPKVGIIRRIIRNIGKASLAGILLQVLLNPNDIIFAPASVEDDVRVFIKKLYGMDNPRIEIGLPRKSFDELMIEFFVRKIDLVEYLSSEEAIEILKESLELINSVRDSINTIKEIYGISEACKYMDKLKKTDRSLYMIISNLVALKCQ